MDTVTVINKGPRKKVALIVVSVIALGVLIIGLAAGLALIRQSQLFKQKAAVSGGTAKVYLSPENKTVGIGDTFTVKVYFDTAGTAVSALSVLLEYSYSGTAPIAVIDVAVNPSLPVEAMWDFPIKSYSSSGGKTFIKIGGYSNSIDGYTTSGQEELATITFQANTAGTINVAFSPTESKITKKTDGADILLIPQSTGTYTVGGSITTAPTSTAAATTTALPSASGSTYTAPPISTTSPIPQTGISAPIGAIIGLGTGLIIASLIIAF